MEMAPGITITQAVVKYESGFGEAAKKLEEQLEMQRNRPAHSLTLGLMGIVRSRKTGLPAIERKGNDYIDIATDKKQPGKIHESPLIKELCENCFGKAIDYKKVAFDIDKMNQKNDWIAIIHADGNGLGKIITAIGDDDETLKAFSEKLDEVTRESAQTAYNKVKNNFDEKKNIPIRPIILGGDDLTIICRADLAIEYTVAFMKSFEEKSNQSLKKVLNKAGLEKLTICAGIAFIKSSYPFHYGYDLAEELCIHAKEEANLVDGLTPSCLMFHKVQDSYVEDYKTIIERELTAKDGISFKYGPYYISNNRKETNIDSLLTYINTLKNDKEGNALKSHFRQWISLLFTNPEMAKQKATRMKAIFNKDLLINEITDLKDKRTPIYDMLSLYSVMYQKTKNNKEDEND
jgi:hypothetical protein